jgi:uncharacterized protein (DUF2236 family)
VATIFSEPPDESFYQPASVLGTMLQVRPEMWPADRAAFGRYWEEGLKKVRIDPPVLRYLHDVAALAFLPGGRIPGGLNLWITTGFLAPEFRSAMGLSWTDRDQLRFEGAMRLLAASRRPLPPLVRRFPLDWFLLDFRLRSRAGLRLI